MKFFLLTLLLTIRVFTALAQPKTYTSFQDYFVVNMNPDSLEKVVYSHKDDQSRYMHELIWLEYSRYKISDNFGNDLATIQKLVSQQRSGVGIAMYNYLMGIRYKSEDAPKALTYFQKALTYFDRTSDTSGMAHCHLALMRLNIDNFNERVGDIDKAKFHYDKTLSLVETSSDPRNKISLMPRYLAELDLFYQPMTLAEVEKKYDSIVQLVGKYPEMRFMLKDIYLNLSFFYILNKDFQTAINKLNLSLKYAAHCSSYNQITIYSNLASANEGLGNYVEMERYLKKILAAGRSKIGLNDYVIIEANFGMAIARTKTKKVKDLLPYLLAYDSLKRAYTERVKIKELLNLQAKYESEKKEATIKTLELEKQRNEDRNQLIMAGLVLALIIIGIISLLAVRLRTTNTELQSLQQSRDKLYTVIAHDLREPINSIMNVGTLLRFLIRQNRSQDVEKVTQQIDLMGQQTSLLLNNLLEWGKNNHFEQQSSPQPFDAAPLLQELTQVYKGLAEAKGVLLSVVIPDHYTLTANPKDLSLIVRNLLDNALKHT
ncbi:tetratricopeptide repeat-containing sensor histidine kinase [Spirosoma pollinicola]|uniref:tetratricopeptide repeat-containing sensor histidine kinase n=1 Tax=Spirosoma pollinicola TaxID=2057025 RepID=UPI0012FD3407|nr:HAMP domain-containing sensor histidine kinase [Spirosoma pollinicola]